MSSLFRSLSGFLSSAIETPPNILAVTRSFSLTSADSGDVMATAVRQPEIVESDSTPTLVPEVDLSHLSAEERQQIASVMERAHQQQTFKSHDVERSVLILFFITNATYCNLNLGCIVNSITQL